MIRDVPVGFVQSSTGQEESQIVVGPDATVERERNILAYMMRRLEVDDGQRQREHDLELNYHKSTIKILWPIVSTAILLVLGCITAGIWLAARGKETLGFSILSGTVAALFGYLGGLGTPRFWKHD